MLPSLTIRQMHEEDLAFTAEQTAAEGWVSENRDTLEGFFINEPGGCFLAEQDGQPLGMSVGTMYGSSGFIGEIIVKQEARGKGIGASLLNHAVSYLKERGVETVYLDGVVRAVPMYERNGFRKVCRSWRFSGHLDRKKRTCVREMLVNDLDQVNKLDQPSFGADRSFYIQRRLNLFPHLCHVMIVGGRLVGFIQGREGADWVSAGPWVVEENNEHPIDLLHALAIQAGNKPISLGILETSQAACDLVQSLGFFPRPDSPWRMALGPSSDLGASLRCYAVGSAATG